MTKPHKIIRLYAWITTDATGEDGIPAFASNLGPMPLVGSDKERIESFRPIAEALHKRDGLPVRLVEFSAMTVLETLGDDPPREKKLRWKPPIHR